MLDDDNTPMANEYGGDESIPPSGLEKLSAGHVLSMLRLQFWIRFGPWNFAFAVRQVAIMAFMALAHVGTKPLARMRLRPTEPLESTDQKPALNIGALVPDEELFNSEWWKDPDGQCWFSVLDRGHVRTIRAPEALAFAVERYRSIRPKGPSDHLFLTRAGLPLEKSSIGLTALTAAKSLPLAKAIPTLLKDFISSRVLGDADTMAAMHFLGRQLENEWVEVSPERLQQLYARIDPFDGELRNALEDDVYACELLRTKYGAGFSDMIWTAKTTLGQQTRERLRAVDHLFVAELLAVEWPEKRKAMRERREELFVQYFPQMISLLVSGKLPQVQAMDLLRYSKSAWTKRVLLATYGDDWWLEDDPVIPGSRKSIARFLQQLSDPAVPLGAVETTEKLPAILKLSQQNV